MDRLCDAESPGVLDAEEREEILAENERRGGEWVDFWAAVQKSGRSQRKFISGRKRKLSSALQRSPRIPLSASAETTPTTRRAGVDDDGCA